jgi:hypothetical protein
MVQLYCRFTSDFGYWSAIGICNTLQKWLRRGLEKAAWVEQGSPDLAKAGHDHSNLPKAERTADKRLGGPMVRPIFFYTV